MNLSKSGPWTYIIFHVHGLDNHQHCVSPRPWHCARGRSLGERAGRRLRRRLCAAGYRGGGHEHYGGIGCNHYNDGGHDHGAYGCPQYQHQYHDVHMSLASAAMESMSI